MSEQSGNVYRLKDGSPLSMDATIFGLRDGFFEHFSKADADIQKAEMLACLQQVERQANAHAHARIAALESEVAEQCRLNGMGSEREARLMAQLADARDTSAVLGMNVRDLEAKLAEANEHASELEKRRGGECDTCGGWVCPPLRCVGCMMKQRITPDADPSVLLADSLKKQDSDLAELRSQLAAARNDNAEIVTTYETKLAAAVRRAEEAERAVGVLGDEAGGARKIVGLDLEWQAKQPCPTAPVYFLLQGATQADECNYHDARAATDANPIAAAAIERARGGTDGE